MKQLFFILVCIVFVYICEGLTKAQLKNTAKTMKSVCQPKHNVSDDLIKNIHKGEFNDNPSVKCYIACILKVAGTMKNGKINYDSAVKQINMMYPEEMREPAIKAMNECKTVPEKYKDICDASFNTAKCLYKSNPDIFFFP